MKYTRVSSCMKPISRMPFHCFGNKFRIPRCGFIFSRCLLLCSMFLLIGFIGLIIVRLRYNNEYTWIQYGFSDQVDTHSAAFSLQGKRPAQEDRFIIAESLTDTAGLFAVFDGHAGDFVVQLVHLHVKLNLMQKIASASMLKQFNFINHENCKTDREYKEILYTPRLEDRDEEFQNFVTFAVDCLKKGTNCTMQTPGFQEKFDELVEINKRQQFKLQKNYDARCYVKDGQINYENMLIDELLLAEYYSLNLAREFINNSGTTALIIVIDGSKLTIANVGDTRAVLCHENGTAIQISVEHQPIYLNEINRIISNGGFIAFNENTWRVGGYLAVSRTLGDFPLKHSGLVCADPDTSEIDLKEIRPKFLIIASDGFWNAVSNQEAVNLAKTHLHERDFGAKSLAVLAYTRGSEDNITVAIVVFQNGKFQVDGYSK